MHFRPILTDKERERELAEAAAWYDQFNTGYVKLHPGNNTIHKCMLIGTQVYTLCGSDGGNRSAKRGVQFVAGPHTCKRCDKSKYQQDARIMANAIEPTIKPSIDAAATYPYKPYIGKTAVWIALTLSSLDRAELWQSACDICEDDSQYALFTGVTISGEFVWETGVGLWEVN